MTAAIAFPQPRPKILLIAPGGFGGVQSFCNALSKGLLDAGYEPHILFEHGRPQLENDPSVPPGVTAKVFEYSSLDNCICVFKRMAALVSQNGYSVVYPNTSAVTYRALGLLGPLRPTAIGGCTGNNPHDYACNTEFADYLDHIFSVSQAGALVLRDRLSGRDLGIAVIPHGVEPANTPPGRSFSSKLRLVFAGRFDVAKRIQDVVVVAQRLRDLGIQLDINLAGEGLERKAIEDSCKRRSVQDTVRCLGFISQAEVERLLQGSHINLLLSESEGFGLSVLEGMKVGCVPIVTETCGCKDAIRDGINGFVVKLGDVRSAVERVRHLDQNRACLALMSEAAARTVREDYTLEREVARHLQVLRAAQEHHHRYAARTIPWKYEAPSLISSPWVPNWLARSLRRLKYAATTL